MLFLFGKINSLSGGRGRDVDHEPLLGLQLVGSIYM